MIALEKSLTKEDRENDSIKFFIIAIVFDNRNRILGVKKKIFKDFLKL